MEPELWLLSPNTAVTAGKIIDQDIFISAKASGENQLQLSPCAGCCWACLGVRSQTSIPLLLPGRDPGVRNSVPFPASDGFASLQYFGESSQAFGRLSIHLLPKILWGFSETSPGNKPKHKASLTPRQKGKERTQFPVGAAARAGDREVKSDNRGEK